MPRRVSAGNPAPASGRLPRVSLPACELPVSVAAIRFGRRWRSRGHRIADVCSSDGIRYVDAQTLAALRPELDIMPSPVPDQPGLLIRDPFQYSDATIIVPPLLARGLIFFDGEHTDLDLQEFLTRATGDLRVTEAARNLIDTMSECGFLVSPEFHEMRDRKQRTFAGPVSANLRTPGRPIPRKPTPCGRSSAITERKRGPNPAAPDSLVALAAPHVSPEGGFRSYAAAYGLNPNLLTRRS